MGIITLLLFVLGVSVIIGIVNIDQEQAAKVMGIPASVGIFVFLSVLVGSFILAVSIPFQLSLSMLHLFYFTVDYRLVCF
jgi:hypothetical protein